MISLILIVILLVIFFGLTYWNMKLVYLHPQEAANRVKGICHAIIDDLQWEWMIEGIEIYPMEICHCRCHRDIIFYTRIVMMDILDMYLCTLESPKPSFLSLWQQVLCSAERIGCTEFDCLTAIESK